MTLKRPFDAYDSPESSTPPRPIRGPPQKRRLTSFPYSSPSTSSTPFTSPYNIYHPPPSDSPTNPFGRIRKLALTSNLTLPRATSFSKHLPLRFQLVRPNTAEDGEGVYRIVQVPLNFTFRHLHKLLLFLFGAGNNNRGKPTTKPRRSTTRSQARDTKRKHSASSLKTGHLFEVHDSMRMHKGPLRPGQIKSARAWAKLSSVRDPLRYRRLDEEVNADAEDGEGEGDDEWIWEAEEDFTLGHVWPEGGDLSRGVTYVRNPPICILYSLTDMIVSRQHHTSTTQVHITINTRRIPGRKGVGNKPFVFSARGLGNLTPNGEDEDVEVNDNVIADATQWNGHDAFDKFLKKEAEREGPLRHPDEDVLDFYNEADAVCHHFHLLSPRFTNTISMAGNINTVLRPLYSSSDTPSIDASSSTSRRIRLQADRTTEQERAGRAW